jgi:hypothetical protein
MDTRHFDEGYPMYLGDKTPIHEGKAFGGPTISSSRSIIFQSDQDVTLEGVDITLLGFSSCAN